VRINGYRFPIWLIAFVAISFLLAILSLYMVGQVMANAPDYAIVPKEFSSNLYIPEKSQLCPGDDLSVDIEFQSLTDETFTFQVVETWATAEGKNVIWEENPIYAISTGGAGWNSKTIVRKVPTLPAGDFQFLHVATTPASSRHPAYFSVPFEIPESCFE